MKIRWKVETVSTIKRHMVRDSWIICSSYIYKPPEHYVIIKGPLSNAILLQDSAIVVEMNITSYSIFDHLLTDFPTISYIPFFIVRGDSKERYLENMLSFYKFTKGADGYYKEYDPTFYKILSTGVEYDL